MSYKLELLIEKFRVSPDDFCFSFLTLIIIICDQEVNYFGKIRVNYLFDER